jgi:hypothetical protein
LRFVLSPSSLAFASSFFFFPFSLSF